MANLPKTQPLMMGTHLSLPALKTPLRMQWLIMCPGPPMQQVLVRQSQGCPGRREEEDVQEDISSHAL